MNSNQTADDPGALDIDLDIVVDVEMSATPADVWNVIWDLDRYGEWNPECIEAHWTEGALGPIVGACFTGRNVLNGRTWTVLCHITECTYPTKVSWTVEDPAFPSSTWTYTITATEAGCLVSERFVHGPGNSGIRNIIRAEPTSASVVIDGRAQMLKRNMSSSLRAIALRAENEVATFHDQP